MADDPPSPFMHIFRVRYAEADMQAVVFNSRYLEYADLLITEYFRDRGIGFSGENSIQFHVAKAEVQFRKPILADELIEGRVRGGRIGNASMTTMIELHGASNAEHGVDRMAGDDLRAEIELVHVHVDLTSGKPLSIPDHARAKLTGNKHNG